MRHIPILLAVFALTGCEQKTPEVDKPKASALDLSSIKVVILDDAGRIVALSGLGESAALVRDPNGSPVWLPIEVSDEYLSGEEEPWLVNPVFKQLPSGTLGIADPKGRVMVVCDDPYFLSQPIVLVRGSKGEPVWKKVRIGSHPPRGEDVGWFASPVVSVPDRGAEDNPDLP